MLVGVVAIKRAKKDVKWALKIEKIEEIFMFYHLTPWQSWKLFLFHSYECQGIQTKNPFDKILSFNFDLGPLKVNTYLSPKRRGPTYDRDHLTPGATTQPDSDLISCT